MRTQHAVLSAIAAALILGWLLHDSWFEKSAEAGSVVLVREIDGADEFEIPAGTGQDSAAAALEVLDSGLRAVVPSSGARDEAPELGPPRADLTGHLFSGDPRLAHLAYRVRWESIDGERGPALVKDLGWRRDDVVRIGEQYLFEGLPTGEYLLYFSPAGIDWLMGEKRVLLQSGENRVDLRIEPIDPQRCLQVRSLDPAGKTVLPSGTFFHMRTSRGGMKDHFPRCLPLEDGSQLVCLPQGWSRAVPGKESVEALVLVVTDRKRGRASLVLRADQRDVVLQFSEPAELDLRIGNVPTRLQGRLRAKVEAASMRGVTNPRRVLGPLPGGDGVYRYTKLEVGTHTVDIYLDNEESIQASQLTLVGTHQVEIAAGKQELTIPCPDLYDVAVSNPSGWPGRELLLERVIGPDSVHYEQPQSAELSGDLRLEFRDCPPGDFLLRCGMLALPITVPCGEVVLRD